MPLPDWQPGASLANLRERARLNSEIRAFLTGRGVLEVETPVLCSAAATDPHLASFCIETDGGPRFLQTSPEFAMKRLLAAGSGPIFQLGKAFREGDSGERHNPEFTLLEWYRPGFSLAALMDEVQALLVGLLGAQGGAMRFAGCDRTSYRALFESRFGFNPHGAATARLQQAVARETTFGDAAGLEAAACLDLLFSTGIEPALGHERPVFVEGFPQQQAALARRVVDAAGDTVAARCEVYVRGMELANAYDELIDVHEQQARFLADTAERRSLGLPEVPVDGRLLAALDHGLPPCAGVALGVDRLLMLRTGTTTLDAVLAFSDRRA